MKKALVLIILSALGLAGTGLFLHAQNAPEPVLPLRYEIWVELDNVQKMIHGREDIAWRNTTGDEVKDIWFHLYWNAFKNERSAFFQDAKDETFARSELPKEGEWGWVDIVRIELADGRDLKPGMEFISPDGPRYQGDQTVLRVPLPEPVLPGGEVRLKIEFESKVPRRAARTAYYQDRFFIAQWFPKPGVYEEGKGWNCHAYHDHSEFFADYADFAVHITVPEAFVVGSSGKQAAAVRDEKGKKTTYTYMQSAIHDFAWTADSAFIKVERDFIASEEVTAAEYQDLSRRLGLSVEELKLPDVKMILLIAPQHKAQIDRHFKALKAALKYYGLWYGPYPYETITMVDPPFRTGSGGMEYPTLFTAGTSAITSNRVWSPEGVIIHEFGHGYWYGLRLGSTRGSTPIRPAKSWPKPTGPASCRSRSRASPWTSCSGCRLIWIMNRTGRPGSTPSNSIRSSRPPGISTAVSAMPSTSICGRRSRSTPWSACWARTSWSVSSATSRWASASGIRVPRISSGSPRRRPAATWAGFSGSSSTIP
jgi:hypothetical protein